MSIYLNKLMLIGIVASEPVYRQVESRWHYGKIATIGAFHIKSCPWGKFTWEKKPKQRKESAIRIRCEVKGGTQMFCEKSGLVCGDLILVQGRLAQESFMSAKLQRRVNNFYVWVQELSYVRRAASARNKSIIDNEELEELRRKAELVDAWDMAPDVLKEGRKLEDLFGDDS